MPEEETRYRVVELGTSGWCVNDPKQDVGLTREQADIRLKFYLEELPCIVCVRHSSDFSYH